MMDHRDAAQLLAPVTLPPGKYGKAEVSRFTVGPEDLGLMLHNMKQPGRPMRPGTYSELRVNGRLWMTDTPAELRDHIPAVQRARGRVLVFGLGLGLVAEAMLRKPDVELLRIVELDEDVIGLVAPHINKLGGDRVQIVQADALEYPAFKSERWQVIWADIWADISSDNLKQMQALRRRWRPSCAWFGCWSEAECKASRWR